MKDSLLDLLLHPIRMGVVQNLIGNRKFTAQQLSRLLPDVPQATLYRHLDKLLKTGIITVIEENQIRGTIEKVYGMAESLGQDVNQEQLEATKEEHIKYFFTFLTLFLDDFQKYVSKKEIDILKDGLSYRRGRYFLTDEEFEEFNNDLKNAFAKILDNEPDDGRKARIIGLVTIPDSEDKRKVD